MSSCQWKAEITLQEKDSGKEYQVIFIPPPLSSIGSLQIPIIFSEEEKKSYCNQLYNNKTYVNFMSPKEKLEILKKILPLKDVLCRLSSVPEELKENPVKIGIFTLETLATAWNTLKYQQEKDEARYRHLAGYPYNNPNCLN